MPTRPAEPETQAKYPQCSSVQFQTNRDLRSVFSSLVSRNPASVGTHIQPLGGGLRAIVPAPRGRYAVGDPAVGDLVGDLVRDDDIDVAEMAGEADLGIEMGEMGFILSPLKAAMGRTGSGAPVNWVRGVGGSDLSGDRMGNTGVLPGLNLAGDIAWGGSGKLTSVFSLLLYEAGESIICEFLEGD
jgi:hypothetical protein